MSDKMRKSFEEWALSEGYPITRGHYFDVYASAETRAAYLAWQAANAAALPPGFVAVPVDELQASLSHIESVLSRAYNSASPVCCGQPRGGECCGSPEPEWNEYDARIIDDLSNAHRTLSSMIAAVRRDAEITKERQS